VFVSFLSDFGLQDDFVGTCHGVIKQIAPETQIIDVTHGIPAQQILQGALVLASTLPYLPAGVHLALVPAAERAGIAGAHELANPEYALETISRTFHGRDLFAPAAAHLSLGVAIEDLGPPIDPDALVRLDLPQAELGPDKIGATVLYVDSFGNVALNVTREHVAEVGIVPGTQVELELGGERFYAVAARTFADARAGDIVLYEDSYRNMSVAISSGNAAEMLHARPGQSLRINVGRI
jgi:S-adenosylmethionine hydrolase